METEKRNRETRNKYRYRDYRCVYKLKSWVQDHEKNFVASTFCQNPCEGAGKVFETTVSKYVNSNLYLKPNHPFNNLCHNPAEWAREYLHNHPQHMDCELLADNPAEWAGRILNRQPKDEILWKELVQNPTEWAGKMIKRVAKSSYFFWDTYYLYSNPSPWVYDVIKKFSLEPVWYILSENPAEWAREMLMKDPERINFSHLCLNPAEWARELLLENPSRIDYNYLCLNPAKWVWEILETNPGGIFWSWLCRNPSDWVVDVLEKNQFHINWYWLSKNPHLFEYDYAFIRERFWNTFGEELMQVCFHPRNMGKFSGWGYESGLEEDLDEDLDE